MRHENKAALAKSVESRAEKYRRAFRLRDDQHAHKILSWRMMHQLDNCADDSARRILLGIGERFEAPR